ncbi:MAG: ATP-binding protein [Oscillospiraceae bacterium]|nr:ATP-binding protein [Oscillospiraceae bacterium]
MFLSIKNLGKIAQAEIVIDAITVIAGKNNTGKSTVGKSLFALFNSFYDSDNRIAKERKTFIAESVRSVYRRSGSITLNHLIFTDLDEVTEPIIDLSSGETSEIDKLHEQIRKILEKYNDEYPIKDFDIDKLAVSVAHILGFSDDEILERILKRTMIDEFNRQINNVYNPNSLAEITLTCKDGKVDVQIKRNIEFKATNSIRTNVEAIYIDDPYIVDSFDGMLWGGRNYREDHRHHLRELMAKRGTVVSVLEEMVADKRLEKVFEKLDSICPGELVRRGSGMRTFVYTEENQEEAINMSNVSTGLKTFAIIKTLLLNGSLQEGGVLILDEPEIHLHPEWQLVFAELIVLIQKEFDMRMFDINLT